MKRPPGTWLIQMSYGYGVKGYKTKHQISCLAGLSGDSYMSTIKYFNDCKGGKKRNVDILKDSLKKQIFGNIVGSRNAGLSDNYTNGIVVTELVYISNWKKDLKINYTQFYYVGSKSNFKIESIDTLQDICIAGYVTQDVLPFYNKAEWVGIASIPGKIENIIKEEARKHEDDIGGEIRIWTLRRK